MFIFEEEYGFCYGFFKYICFYILIVIQILRVGSFSWVCFWVFGFWDMDDDEEEFDFYGFIVQMVEIVEIVRLSQMLVKDVVILVQEIYDVVGDGDILGFLEFVYSVFFSNMFSIFVLIIFVWEELVQCIFEVSFNFQKVLFGLLNFWDFDQNMNDSCEDVLVNKMWFWN